MWSVEPELGRHRGGQASTGAGQGAPVLSCDICSQPKCQGLKQQQCPHYHDFVGWPDSVGWLHSMCGAGAARGAVSWELSCDQYVQVDPHPPVSLSGVSRSADYVATSFRERLLREHKPPGTAVPLSLCRHHSHRCPSGQASQLAKPSATVEGSTEGVTTSRCWPPQRTLRPLPRPQCLISSQHLTQASNPGPSSESGPGADRVSRVSFLG